MTSAKTQPPDMRWWHEFQSQGKCHCKCACFLQSEGKMDNTLMPALAFAACLGHVVCLSAMIETGADVNLSSHTGTSPLMWTAAMAQHECLTMWLNAGADVNLRNDYKETASHYACDVSTFVNYRKNDHTKCIKFLVKAGADVNAISRQDTPLTKAAGCTSDDNCVGLLLKAGAKVDPQGRWYSTPLGMATEQGNVKNMKLLIEAGADVNYDTGIYSRRPPLIVAAENGEPSKIKLLLSAELM